MVDNECKLQIFQSTLVSKTESVLAKILHRPTIATIADDLAWPEAIACSEIGIGFEMLTKNKI